MLWPTTRKIARRRSISTDVLCINRISARRPAPNTTFAAHNATFSWIQRRKIRSSLWCYNRLSRRTFVDGGKKQQNRTANDTAGSLSDAEALAARLSKLGQDPDAVSALTKQLNDSERQQLARLLCNNTTTSSQQQAAAAAAEIPEPSRRALQLVALNTAIPFIGFGVMDNAILIIAGDAIDTSLGVLLGISTMCAAAIGNIISDVAGIMLGTAIEDFCAQKLSLPTPDLTSAQRQLRSVRFANQWGCAVGIVVGCIIGMFPLLFIDSNKIQAKKREAHLDSIFRDVVTDVGSLVGAARTCLYLLVDNSGKTTTTTTTTTPLLQRRHTKSPVPVPDGKFLYAKYDDRQRIGKDLQLHEQWIPLGRGIVSRAALTGESWNIQDVTQEPDFAPDLGYEKSGVRNMLVVPVVDSSGRPIAVIQAINKIGKGRGDDNVADDDDSIAAVPGQLPSQEPPGFTENDVQILKALASHISVSLQRMYESVDGEEAETTLKDTIRLLKDYGLAGISAKDERRLRDSRLKVARRPLFPED